MCEYCEKERIIYMDMLFVSFIDVLDKEFCIDFDNGEYTASMEIKLNYCPMCGRKL